jgi:hypothetical protein
VDALGEDAKAAASGEESVLAFDPFAHSQKPGAAARTVEKVTLERDTCLATMQNGHDVSVTAELERKDGGWRFVNFYYPPSGDKIPDLLGILKELANDRAFKKD